MPSRAVPPPDQPDDEKQKRGREVFSMLAEAYNEGCEQGGAEEGFRRLHAKLDELSPRPYETSEPLYRHFANGSS